MSAGRKLTKKECDQSAERLLDVVYDNLNNKVYQITDDEEHLYRISDVDIDRILKSLRRQI